MWTSSSRPTAATSEHLIGLRATGLAADWRSDMEGPGVGVAHAKVAVLHDVGDDDKKAVLSTMVMVAVMEMASVMAMAMAWQG